MDAVHVHRGSGVHVWHLLEQGIISIFMVPCVSPRWLGGDVPIDGIGRTVAYVTADVRSGDECWSDLTCASYHCQTCPVPNPMTWYLHDVPSMAFQKFSTFVNHVVELRVRYCCSLREAAASSVALHGRGSKPF